MARKKHRVFLDSNVILSGLLSDRGSPRLILDLLCLELPGLAGLTGRFNLTEIERNLGKKLPGALPVYRLYLPKLRLEVVPLPSPDDVRSLAGTADEKDLPVLASAVNGAADFFISGDKRLLSQIGRSARFDFKEFVPAEFLGRVLPGILAGERRG